MGKITVTVCDNCAEQIVNPEYPYIVTVQDGDTTRKGDLCDTCFKGLGLQGLPELKKRQYNKKA